MTDPAASRRAAIEAERERLKRAQERRQHRGPGGVSGFAQRKWRWLGVSGGEALQAVLAALHETVASPELPEETRSVLEQAREGSPDREALLPAIRAGLSRLPPESVLAHIRSLWAAGVRWLNDAGSERCRLLCSTAPSLDFTSRRSHAVSGRPAFSLFATAATRGAIPIPNRHLDAVLSWAPLSVIDDLVEHGGLLPEDAPWQGRNEEEGLYLRARLAPRTIADAEAEELDWTAYTRRRTFLSGQTVVRQEPEDVWDLLYDVLIDGDIAGLNALDAALPREQQVELRDLKSGALSGQWSPKLTGDRGLWLLMATLWQPDGTVDAGRSPFYALVALNHAYDLLKAGEIEAAAQQARSLTREGDSRNVPPEFVHEGHAMTAYTSAVSGRLEVAEEHAKKAAESGDDISARNLTHVRAWRATPKNRRGPVTNPFLEIGLDHGAAGWEERCREVFRQHEGDATAQSRLNWAEDRIREALRSEAGWGVFFQVPLDRSRYVFPSVVPQCLVPPLEPLPRRTSVTSGGDLETIRARAAVELLEDFRTTAPHLDRHSTR